MRSGGCQTSRMHESSGLPITGLLLVPILRCCSFEPCWEGLLQHQGVPATNSRTAV